MMAATIKKTKYTYRFLAKFVIEAKTPLSVGSGEKDIITDALVAKDVNGLPYIPGTAISGVVRSMLRQQDINTDSFFGFQNRENGEGSQVIFSEAKILNSKSEVIDGLYLTAFNDSLLKEYKELPIRQHVRINEFGVAADKGKFDEQVVFAGSRFCFELEMVSSNEDLENFNNVLKQIQSKTFRIGSGTRCGFGEIEVVDLQTKKLDLTDPSQLQEYINKPSSLNSDYWDKKYHKPDQLQGSETKEWIKYELKLNPADFFLFSSGFGDEDADITPVKSKKVVWSNGNGVLQENLVLIPASSVKGALAHRTAFHYNKFNLRFAGCEGDKKPRVGNENEAVQALFGYEIQEKKEQVRGNLIFSDVIEKPLPEKILNHVAIDRFTGGGIDGALFTEKTTYGKGQEYTISIYANKKATEKEYILSSLEEALKDICKGLLPLGGGVNRGNGVFTGSLIKDGKIEYENK